MNKFEAGDIKAITWPDGKRVIEHLFVASDKRPSDYLLEDGNTGVHGIPVMRNGEPAVWLAMTLQDVDEPRTRTFPIDNGIRTCHEHAGGVLLDRKRLEKLKELTELMLAVIDNEKDRKWFVRDSVSLDDERSIQELAHALRKPFDTGSRTIRM